MADDYHRPTLTFPTGAYNATQVRLYGKAADSGLIYPNNPRSVNSASGNVSVSTDTTVSDDEINDFKESLFNFKMTKKLSDSDIFHEMIVGTFPFPIKIPVGLASQLIIDVKKFGTLVISTSITLTAAVEKQKSLSCGIVVGYSYEGHCYDLPKPKIMIIPDMPRPIPVDDCGYDVKSPEQYRLWIVDKLDECVEFEMNQGFIEQLVLEANLPGKRSPTMYAGRMMLGHRSGRLTD